MSETKIFGYSIYACLHSRAREAISYGAPAFNNSSALEIFIWASDAISRVNLKAWRSAGSVV